MTFDSLSKSLDGWFDKPMDELPDEQRHRVETDFSPMPWDDLSPDQRRYRASEWDYQHDPAMESDRQYWRDFYIRMGGLEEQIEKWSAISTPTATDLAKKESRLAELQRELANMKKEEKQPHRICADRQRNSSLGQSFDVPHSADKPEYIAYPKAMRILSARLNATPEEVAAWVFMGQNDGDLAAYTNANEMDPPPRFYFGYYMGEGYLSPMMACWFREDDIANFQPADRYITGKALIERWSEQPGIKPEAFIRAKITESRLLDIHPITGTTQWSEGDSFPAKETALFALSQIEEIETSDFGSDKTDSPTITKPPGHLNRDPEMQQRANEIDEDGSSGTGQSTPAKECAIFRAMEKLIADQVTIIFVGDKPESGIGANNMLEISARGETKRVPLAALDLVDRRSGSLNSQCAILLGMTQKMKQTRTDNKFAAQMTRLRAVFRTHMGITDPFADYREGIGWETKTNEHGKRFIDLPVEEQKQLLVALLDKNFLYVNLTELDAPEMRFDKSTCSFNRCFYGIAK